MFAAQLRGAKEESDALSWMIERGYAVEVGNGQLDLTEAGSARATAIIEGDPGLHQ